MLVAGNGTAAYSGDSGLAINASLHHPAAVCFDNLGNYFIADEVNNAIRKVTISTGIITTIAGNGISDFSGDSGLAINATLNYPNGVSLDANGKLYIADALNNRIRMIDLNTNIITTVAGNGNAGYSGDIGPAIFAELNIPEGLYAEPSGNVYIADEINNVIRKLDALAGTIVTIAGNGSAGYSGDNGLATNARLNQPNGVYEDNANNLYIADSRNAVIRKVDLSTGIISTIAGNGTAGYSGDSGLAINAELYQPVGVTMDYYGNVYIADINNTVRKVDVASGKIFTIAGNGNPGCLGDGGPPQNALLTGPNGVAFDQSGNLYIADEWDNRVRAVVPAPPPNVVKTNSLPKILTLYPNPSNGSLTLSLSEGSGIVKIIDALGRIVYSKAIKQGKEIISTKDWMQGLFIVKYESEEGAVQLNRFVNN